MTSTGATPAYRGYRLQALYSLHRLLEQVNETLTFQPEGAEDLAVFGATGDLQEVIQVKALSHDLVLSDFNPQKPDSFFYRANKHLASDPQARVRIVSYGPIGPELDAALRGDASVQQRIAARLGSYGHLSEADAEELLRHIEFVTVQEAELLKAVDATIRQSQNGIDPRAALSLMTAWLYECAEHQRPIKRQDVLAKVVAIGSFLAECAAHQREWFTSIVPISETSISDARLRELDEEYYQGIAARYEHIVAGLDVLRSAMLERLANAFHKSPVVVLHGASGQGKSTLAYRYLHEYVPDNCRYQVLRIESVTHALSVATALLGHVEAMGVSLGIYLDVTPNDIGWDELVRRLGHHDRIRVLVTMREEDWRKATISPTEVPIAEVPLWFDETEARALYRELVAHRQPAHILTFEDAWAEFGGQGPLLEFVYVVTQGTALRERLRRQIDRLQDEVRLGKLAKSELMLLRLVSVAGATGARMQAARLAEYLGLSAPARTLALFENEYLLRLSPDGRSVGPLHAVRSTILIELLSDPVFSPAGESAANCLPLLLEEDVERFLLGVFVYQHEAVETVAARASLWQPDRWVAIGGVVNALLWLGVSDYVTENRELLGDVFGEVGDGATWLLEFDVAGTLPGGTAALQDALSGVASSEFFQRSKAFRARQSSPERVFTRLRAYLADRRLPPLLPSTEGDWEALAEVSFWLGHLKMRWTLARWLPESVLDNALTSLPLETLADVVLALYEGSDDHEGFVAWLISRRERIVGRLRSETHSLAIEDDGEKVTTHFFVEADSSLQVADSRDRPHERANLLARSNAPHQQDAQNLHAVALQHITLLRRLFPDRQLYACQGYGHRIVSWELPTDDTRKTGIPRSRLHAHWQTTVNATFRGLAELEFRPVTWEDYVRALLHLRRTVSSSLDELQRGLDTYFRKPGQVRILGEFVSETGWNTCRRLLRTELALPRAAVDPWGRTDEHSANPVNEGSSGGLERRAVALQQYVPLLTATTAYTTSLRNFFDQAVDVMITNPVVGRVAQNAAQRRLAQERAEELGFKPQDAPRLSALNCVSALQALDAFQSEFRLRLVTLVPGNELADLEREERRALIAVWERWYIFAYHPERVVQHPGPYCHDYLANLRAQAKRRLDQVLRAVSADSRAGEKIEAQIRSEQICWDDKLTLWITLDGDRPVNAYACLESTIGAIRRALAAEPEEELRQYLLTIWWPQIAIVPLARGKSLNGSAWRIPTAAFVNTGGVGGINVWNMVQQDIPVTTRNELGIATWQLPGMQEAIALTSSVSGLSLLTGHLRDLAHGPELDAQGTSDMQQYLQRIEPSLTEALQATIDAATRLHATLSMTDAAADTESAYRIEARSRLTSLQEAIVPIEGTHSLQTPTIRAIAAWADSLDQLREQSFLISLAVASAALQERTDSDTNAEFSSRMTVEKKKKRKHKRRRM